MADEQSLDIAQVSAFWVTEAEEALEVAHHLVAKADYSYALFFGHLALEKMLKAHFVFKQERHAPPLHNLLRLALAAELHIDALTADKLTTITALTWKPGIRTSSVLFAALVRQSTRRSRWS